MEIERATLLPKIWLKSVKTSADITLDEAKGILAYMDKMIDLVKRQLGDNPTDGYEKIVQANINTPNTHIKKKFF